MQGQAREQGEPIPAWLSADLPLFNVPAGLLRILDRDLKLAGIPKRDDRRRILDVHALRTTFGTLLRKGRVAPRTAQAAMGHSDIRLTMETYTDSRFLDVRGALEVLPTLPLAGRGDRERGGATGTAADAPGLVTPTAAPTDDKRGQTLSLRDNPSRCDTPAALATSGSQEKTKDPLTTAVSGSGEWALRDSNPRPHGCDANGLDVANPEIPWRIATYIIPSFTRTAPNCKVRRDFGARLVQAGPCRQR
jgi:hypothetical protein